jgi:CBS domain-containing protein
MVERATHNDQTHKQQVMNIGDLMTGDLVVVEASDAVSRARQILVESGLHALPVVDSQGEAVGMVTAVELAGEPAQEAVGSVMAGPLVTLEYTASVSEAASLMRSEHLHHLVVTDNGQTVGLLSSYDLLYMLIE